MNASDSKHIVAIFGGAVSGSEAAYQLSQKGIQVVVFDQNTLPYGKIEDGLPKWHVKLRDKEEGKINNKLSHPLVHYVPKAELGKDLDFEDVVNNWGFSAVILAIGAWRDRPLPLDGIEKYLNNGFYYQNPFIYWYNHKHEPDFKGQSYKVADEAAVVGGGLASLDVAKVFMFETVQKALEERGHKVNLFELDRSIAKVLDGLGLTLDDLGIKGCTLYYRRRIKDMPLSPMVADTPEKLEKAQKVREKILNNYQGKYLFNMAPCHMPTGIVTENGQLTGLKFVETQVDENGKVSVKPNSEKEVTASVVVSSIGSIPQVINGIPMKGQVYKVVKGECCHIDGFDHVFAVGNAVTGRGNINESLKHGRAVTQAITEKYLTEDEELHEEVFDEAASLVQTQMQPIANEIAALSPPSEEVANRLMERVKALQQKAGYQGDFTAWAEQHRPVRLEDLLGGH